MLLSRLKQAGNLFIIQTKMANEPQAEPQVEGEATAAEEVVEKFVTTSDLNTIVEQMSAKFGEALERREKKFKMTPSAENEYKLEETKKQSKTVAFFKSLVNRDLEVARKMHVERAKFLNEGTGTAGGFLVPEEFDLEVITKTDDFSQLRSDARVIPMASNILNLASLTTDVTAAYTGEGVTKPNTETAFGQPVLTLRKIAATTTWSDELAEDNEANLVSYLASRFAEVIAEVEQNELVNGVVAGSEGLLVDAGTTIEPLPAGNPLPTDVTFDDLKNMIAALRAISIKEDQSAKFYMSPGVWNALCQTKAAGGAGTYFGGNPVNGWSTMAWGKEVVLLNEMPSTGAAGTNFAVYGDLSRHLYIGEKGGLKVDTTRDATINSENLFEQDLTGMRAVKRVGNTIVLPECLIVAQTTA